uniref:PfG2 protein n=1 Tax=Ptychodera flava TaxID=63121 RepID=Q9U8R0_PTYFL|nr:PfG2 [Ptychodera flava]
MITMDLKIIFMLVACVVYASAHQQQEPAATVTLKTYGFGSSCYPKCIKYEVYCQQDDDDHPYQQKANAVCRSRFIRGGPRGRLAVLNNAYVDGEIRDLIKSNRLHKKKCIKNHGFFIGLSDSGRWREGKYDWVNGDRIGQNDYQNWARGQPDNDNKQDELGQDCVQLWFRNGNRGKWDDEYCNFRPKGFVCEVPDNHCSTL